LKKYIVFFILITYLLNCRNYSFAQENNKSANNVPIIMATVGFILFSSILTAFILKDPKLLFINTESLVLRELNNTESIERINLNTLFSINYNFSNFEISVGLLSGNNSKNTILLDYSIKLTKDSFFDIEKVGISPFLNIGISTALRNFNKFGLGLIFKTGFMSRIESIIFEFSAGYRYIDSNDFMINTFIVGGGLGYIF